MTPEELQQELRDGTLRPAYLLAGAEALLRDDALEALRQAVLGTGPADFDFDRLEGERTTPGGLLDAVRTLPVLAPRRLVVLREPEARRGRAGDLGDAVAAAVEATAGGSTVLVVVAAKVDKRSRWVKAFRAPAVLVACDPPKGGRAVVAFAREEAARQGLTLGPGAAEALAEAVGPQLLLLRGELEKAALLAGPGERVTREHVIESASQVAEEPIWDLTDAIGEGRTADALALLSRMLRAGAPPPVVLGALTGHFRRLTRARHGGQLAGHPFAVRKWQTQARRYTPERLLACLRALHEVDEVLKGQGGIAHDVALQRLVMGLAA